MFSTKFSSSFLVIMLLVSFLPADISRDKLIAPVCNMISRSIPRAIENHPGDEKPIIFQENPFILKWYNEKISPEISKSISKSNISVQILTSQLQLKKRSNTNPIS